MVDTVGVFEDVLESDAEDVKESLGDTVGEADADLEARLEPVLLRDASVEALVEAQKLSRDDADALRRADVLAPPTVVLPRAVILFELHAEAHMVARPVNEFSEDVDADAVLSLLTLADDEIDSATDSDTPLLTEFEGIEEPVPQPAPAEPLLLSVPLPVELSVPPAAVKVDHTDGEAGKVALGAPDLEPPELGEPLAVADWHAEEVDVAGHTVALTKLVSDGALEEENKPVVVPAALSDAAKEALRTDDGEAPLLSEGGGERLSDGLRKNDGEVAALAVPLLVTKPEALNEGL